MDENREDIINDLIKYYDDGDKIHTEESTAEPEEILGDTVKVDIKKKTVFEEVAVPQETIKVEIKRRDTEDDVNSVQSGGTTVIDMSQVMPQIPQDEVLGGIDFDAGFDAEEEEISQEKIPVHRPDTEYEERKEQNYNPREDGADKVIRRKRKGLWYSLKPLWITIIICAAIYGGFNFYITDTGIIGTYKRNFEYNFNMILDALGIDFDVMEVIPAAGLNLGGLQDNTAELETENMVESEIEEQTPSEVDNVREEPPSIYGEVREATATLPFEEAGSSGFAPYGNGVVCAKSNYVCYVNINGEKEWEYKTSVSNPIVKSAGKFFVLASKGGTQLEMYDNGELKYSTELKSNIRTCDVSERGDTVLVTDRTGYKGAVRVINRNGEEIFSWSSGVNYITDAAALKTRRIAVSLVDAREQVTSYVMLFDVNSAAPVSGVKLDSTLLYALDNSSSMVTAEGDNCIFALHERGEIAYDKRFDDVSINNIASDKAGNRLVSFTQENTPVLNVYNKNGELVTSMAVENVPTNIDIYDKTVAYNNERDIICGSALGDKTIYTAPMNICDIILVSNHAYLIVYENSVQFIKI